MSNNESSQEPENAFEAPQANLSDANNSDKPILEMERFSAWGVFFLSIITLSIYSYYWFITRAKQINSLSTESKANLPMFYIYIVYAVISTGIAFIEITDPTFALINMVTTIVFTIILLIGVFSLRSAIEEVINKGSEEHVHLNKILTFFFSFIYFQYKMNEAIDNQSD
ncbi:MAG: DUF4234 domain-containing protein [Alteromonadaceae bacterium]|nr:DUF4234 domain-containing protein [Alteromonadaceae bacterium]